MSKRIWLAGLLGAIGMFVWASMAHIVLPLGTAGISEVPNEASVLAAMQASIGTTSGLYFFPGMGVPLNASRDAQPAAMQNYDTASLLTTRLCICLPKSPHILWWG